MPKKSRKINTQARNNPALLLTGIFGVAGLLASVGAYFLKGTTEGALKVVVPPLIGGTTGYLAGTSLKLDKTSHTAATVLGTAIGYVVGNYIEQKKEDEACSGWGSLKPSCWWPSLFGSPVSARSGLYQPSAEQRALLDQANQEASNG